MVISSSRNYDYVGRFAYTGTRDYTPFCTLPKALQFIDEDLGGMLQMREYCYEIVRKGAEILTTRWNTYKLVADEMQGVMINVVLPELAQSDEITQMLQLKLFEEYQITFVSGSVHIHQPEDKKVYYTRISGQVYLTEKDFEVLADAVLSLLSR